MGIPSTIGYLILPSEVMTKFLSSESDNELPLNGHCNRYTIFKLSAGFCSSFFKPWN